MSECDCGAAVEGKWADIHAPSCPAVSLVAEIEELIRANCRAVEGWPVEIDGIENAAAAIFAKFELRKKASQ